MVEMPVAAVACKVGEHNTRFWHVFKFNVNKKVKRMDISNVKRIAMDETPRTRGHKYVTLFVDSDTKRVIFITTGKGADVLQEFC